MISAILNLGQDVSEDWPLFVRDHGGEDHAVSGLVNNCLGRLSTNLVLCKQLIWFLAKILNEDFCISRNVVYHSSI